MKKRFTDEQIVRILQEAEPGMSTRDLLRKHQISEQTFYRWKTKFGGMDVAEVRGLKDLKRENAELKRLVTEQALDIRMLKDVNEKKLQAFQRDGGRQRICGLPMRSVSGGHAVLDATFTRPAAQA